MAPPHSQGDPEFDSVLPGLMALFVHFMHQVAIAEAMAVAGIARGDIEVFVDNDGWNELEDLFRLPFVGCQLLLPRVIVLGAICWLRKQKNLAQGAVGRAGGANGGSQVGNVGYQTPANRVAVAVNALTAGGTVPAPGAVMAAVQTSMEAAMLAAPVDEGGLDVVRVLLEGGASDSRLPDPDADLVEQCAGMLKQGDHVDGKGAVRRSSPEVFKYKTLEQQVRFLTLLAKSLERRRLSGAASQAYLLIRFLLSMPETVAVIYYKRKFAEGGLSLARVKDKELLDDILLEQASSWYVSDPAEMRSMRKHQKQQDHTVFQLKVKLEEMEQSSSIGARAKKNRRGKVKVEAAPNPSKPSFVPDSEDEDSDSGSDAN